ncbi:hypothetical protein NDK50_33780 [Paraburkholderia bryophila]|uniref:VENN motif pre-toxin domain-containing protein n=1 Tax=Paraburkholderia bryophila TaxID=420952 RepID=UPI00234BE70E|nr:hypothetical protein [Paraburkholderia bryophila]WCM22949.1 hypothetical protein NDK50_33780 [Paraburkholderia bryophila]
MGAATSSVIGSLLAPADNLTASEREARDNLVTSLVAGIAGASGLNAATAAGAGKIEVENNQVSLSSSSPPPPWLAGLLKLPGYKGETASKGDGVIADPATELAVDEVRAFDNAAAWARDCQRVDHGGGAGLA